MIEEIHKRVGSLFAYVWYLFLVFCWYFLENVYSSTSPVAPGSFIEPLLGWGFRILIVPFLLAGVYGGIYRQQRTPESSSISAFFYGLKTYSLRMLLANLIGLVFVIVVTILVFVSRGIEQPDFEGNEKLVALITIPYSVVMLFWFVGIVVERKILSGLFYGIRTLLFNPFALTIGILWGAIGFADTLVSNYFSEQTSFAVDGIRAGVVAAARILATAYGIAVYRIVRGSTLDESTEQGETPEYISATPTDKLIKASVWFSVLSFLPLIHLVAVFLGFIALKRKKQFLLSPLIACCVGGFFTILYLLVAVGWLIRGPVPSNVPVYTFLADSNVGLGPYRTLLEQGSFQEIQGQLEPNVSNSPDHHWTFDALSALAKFQAYELDGALQDFHTAAKKNPERSEFYYFYGIALLDNEQEQMAAEQFQIALRYEPGFEEAEKYLNLINSTYSPSIVVSSLGFVIILLLLFTFHEYGHAFVAWKLGDDTAKEQGRLTLNPVPHLDLFGSLILPAILLWQQAEVMFGWAKPVPINPDNFKEPKKDHMRVAFAGPAMNLLIAMVCIVILGGIMLFVRLFWPESASLNFATPFSSVSLVGPPFARLLMVIVVFLKQFFYTSLALGCFNLIPVPPLDGSWILSGLLPHRFSNFIERTRQYSFVIFLILVMTPVFDYFLAIPVGLAWGGLGLLVWAIGLG